MYDYKSINNNFFSGMKYHNNRLNNNKTQNIGIQYFPNSTYNTSFNTQKTVNIKEENIQNRKKESSRNEDKVLFEFFGLKIYFDDVLLICILLFLYEEGIDDKYLFISLILLLLN